MAIFLKTIFRFNIITIKIPTGFSCKIDNPILKFILKYKGANAAQRILEKRTLPHFKCATIIEAVWFCIYIFKGATKAIQ